MARIGTIPATCRPCQCESPHLDSKGAIFLDNSGTYRVRYCQVCGGGYDSVRDAEPLPRGAPIDAWACRRCGASNLVHYERCTNCPRAEIEWQCRECKLWNPDSEMHCARCGSTRGHILVLT